MNKKGFTLMEILMTIGILALIMVIAFPPILKYYKTAKEGVFLNEIKTIYKEAEKKYPKLSLSTGDITMCKSESGFRNPLDIDEDENTFYRIEFDRSGNVTYFHVNNENYSVYIEDGNVKLTDLNEVDNIYSSVSDCYNAPVTAQESCFAFNLNTKTITGYNFDTCPSDIVIPATIGGIPVEHIADGFGLPDTALQIVYYETAEEECPNYGCYYELPYDVAIKNKIKFDGYEEGTYFIQPTEETQKVCYNPTTDTEDIVDMDKVYGVSDGYIECYFINTGDYSGRTTSVDFSYATNLISIGNDAFSYSLLTGSLDLSPATKLKSIGIAAFQTNNITSVTFPDSLTTINDWAFYENALTTVTLPPNITKIEVGAFEYNNIETLNLNSKLKTIEDWAFGDNIISNVSIPSSVTSIGYCSFCEHVDWTNVTIEENSKNDKYRFNASWRDIGWPIELMKEKGIENYTLALNSPNNFKYSGTIRKITIEQAGYYKMEVWGSQGHDNLDPTAGSGGFSRGIVNLKVDDVLYVVVGSSLGYNGGLNGGAGASDIRINSKSLFARVIVAGAGGSCEAGFNKEGDGHGGGNEGIGSYADPGTQISGGKGYCESVNGVSSDGGFGYGGKNLFCPSPGGSGWYGGGGEEEHYLSAGGSGWVYTSDSFATWQEGNPEDARNYLLNSDYYLLSAYTLSAWDYEEGFISITGEPAEGHFKDGFAKITYMGVEYEEIPD